MRRYKFIKYSTATSDKVNIDSVECCFSKKGKPQGGTNHVGKLGSGGGGSGGGHGPQKPSQLPSSRRRRRRRHQSVYSRHHFALCWAMALPLAGAAALALTLALGHRIEPGDPTPVAPFTNLQTVPTTIFFLSFTSSNQKNHNTILAGHDRPPPPPPSSSFACLPRRFFTRKNRTQSTVNGGGSRERKKNTSKNAKCDFLPRKVGPRAGTRSQSVTRDTGTLLRQFSAPERIVLHRFLHYLNSGLIFLQAAIKRTAFSLSEPGRPAGVGAKVWRALSMGTAKVCRNFFEK